MKSPPRPIAPGDVVAAYSDELGEWTAAQVTDLDPDWGAAGVLDLDWSGPEPHSPADVALVPLRQTHHAFAGQLSLRNYEWLLPRSYKVLGNVPLLHDRRSSTYASGWHLGARLSSQRRWDSGERVSHHPGERTFPATEIAGLAQRSERFPGLWSVSVTDIASLDAGDLVTLFPHLTRLSLTGDLGTLHDAAALNRFPRLKTLFITDLFGLSAADVLRPARTPNMEMIGLHSVPADYATAMRKMWKPEIPHGTCLEITSPRKPGWVAENRANPLREWDGRSHISAARYRRAVAQFRTTRRAVLDLLAGPEPDGSASAELGRQFGEAFNQLDGTRDPFIETVEREELFAALDAIVDEAETRHGRTFDTARRHLSAGVESVRNW